MNERSEFLCYLLRAEPELRAFIGSLVFDPYEREDTFQEVALVLWEQFHKYDSTRSFAAWARGVAANKILQLREKLTKRPTLVSKELIEAVRVAFDESEEFQHNRIESLRKCLELVSPSSRQLIRLRYEQEKNCAQIAQELGTTLESIYKALSRLRQRLETCIQQRLNSPIKGAIP